jgi:parvulin-like peptidyl-prolyl isomerase
VVALVVSVVLGACGDSVRPVAATVNSRDITQAQLDLELDAIAGNAQYLNSIEQSGVKVKGDGDNTLTNDFVGKVLTRQIFLDLVTAELERLKLKLTDAELEDAKAGVLEGVGGDAVFAKFPKAYQDLLVRRSAEVTKLQAQLSGVTADDATIKAFYEDPANQSLFIQTCVSHILFAAVGAGGAPDEAATAAQSDKLNADATAAKARIDGGADFATVARELSTDTSNKDKGGDLGCGPPGQFVPEFETAMDALKDNEVSAPVQTQFGWHLIKVTGRPPQTLAEAHDTIVQRLQADAQDGFGKFVEDAIAKAKITVNPRYGRFSKDGQSPGIVPPGAPTTTEPGGATPGGGEAPLTTGP